MGGVALPVLGVVQAGVGLAAASNQAAAQRRAAAQARTLAEYNADVAQFNAELRAQGIQYQIDAQKQDYAQRGKEALVVGTSESKAMGAKRAGEAASERARVAAGVGSDQAGAAVAENDLASIAARNSILTQAGYQRDVAEFNAHAATMAGIKEIYNTKLIGLFEAQNAIASGYAAANQHEYNADNTMSAGLVGAVAGIARPFLTADPGTPVAQPPIITPQHIGSGASRYDSYSIPIAPLVDSYLPTSLDANVPVTSTSRAR